MKTLRAISSLSLLLLTGGIGAALADGVWRSQSTTGDDGRTRTIVVQSADGAAQGQRDVTVTVSGADAAQPAPATWIGVRVSAVPEAVAAHIGRDGLMVVNVAKGSPADTAGLERYDVLVSIDRKPITDLSSLTQTIGQIGDGKSASLVVVRGGKERTVSVSPARRPSDTPEFKYEEPNDETAQSDVRYFGHRLQKDTNGNWMFEPLGRLRDLPPDVRDRLGDIGSQKWQSWMEAWKDFQANPFRMKIQVDPSDPDGNLFFFPDGDNADEKFEMQVKTFRDGAGLSINRDQGGKIRVTRENADGTKTETSYDSLDELKTKDSDAYETYRRYSGYRARPMIKIPPEMKDLDGLQRDFQERIEKLLQEAQQSMQNAQQSLQSPPQQPALQQQQRVRINSGKGMSSRSVSQAISIDADGRIHISINDGGQTRTYDFRDRAEFEKAEPDLFKRFEGWFENDAAPVAP